LKIPINIVLKVDKSFKGENDIIKFLSTFNGSLLPDDVNMSVYSSFLKIGQYEKCKKITFPKLVLKVKFSGNAQKELEKIMEKLNDELMKFGSLSALIYGKSNFSIVWKKGLEFECVSVLVRRTGKIFNSEIRLKMKGYLDIKVIKAFNKKIYECSRSHLEKISGGPREVDSINLSDKTRQDSANFIFIRSLLDFINSAPSESFSRAFLQTSQRYPFLFEPKNKFWDKLLKETDEQQKKILYPLLLRTRGLTRQEFETVIKWWVNMIIFLRKECDGDAGKFFNAISSKLGIDAKRKDALEVMQSLLENYDEIKTYLGLSFPYSLKAGRLFLTMMTKNERGFDLMDGVNKEHVRELNLPVDAQVLRVALNTGLIEITWVQTEEFEHNGRNAKVLPLMRSDMTELGRVAWKLVAENINIPVIELDYLIYSIGSLLCNRFGKSCYVCPITDVCKSWSKRKIREGSGVDWNRIGMFSYGKGEFDALVIRPCERCNGTLAKCVHKYDILKFSSKQDKIDLDKIK